MSVSPTTVRGKKQYNVNPELFFPPWSAKFDDVLFFWYLTKECQGSRLTVFKKNHMTTISFSP
jgi:hypothetical protein